MDPGWQSSVLSTQVCPNSWSCSTFLMVHPQVCTATPVYEGLGVEPRASWILGKHSTNWPALPVPNPILVLVSQPTVTCLETPIELPNLTLPQLYQPFPIPRTELVLSVCSTCGTPPSKAQPLSSPMTIRFFFFSSEGETGELVLSGVMIKFIPVVMMLSVSLVGTHTL